MGNQTIHITGLSDYSPEEEALRQRLVNARAASGNAPLNIFGPETILDEAARITSADRQNAYGHPADHHGATAAALTAYLRRAGKLMPDATLTAVDWEMAVILDKTMRMANAPMRDHLTDIAGYARCAEKSLARDGGPPFIA